MESQPDKKRKRLPETQTVASANECTGLMPTPPMDDGQNESYKELFSTSLPEDAPAGKPRRITRR